MEKFEIVATLDSHTSHLCQSLDGKIQDMKDYQPGVTAPPFHPWCRTTTVPYFDDNYGERIARDAKTGETYYVPSDMKYPEWKATQDAKYGEGFVDKQRKKAYNKSADTKQFEEYKARLGKNAPKSLDEFQELKYSDDWSAFKAYSRMITSGELSTLANFELYKDTSEEIDRVLVGVVTRNGLTITGKSDHSIARVIGSVEQKRNGVQISDILDALTSDKSEILSIKKSKNGRSQKFRNKVVEVSVNPDTGNIIQVNPVHSGKKVKS